MKERTMRHQKKLLMAGLALILTAPLGAQSTFTPSFNAPYRAFTKSEIGAIVSFPNGARVANSTWVCAAACMRREAARTRSDSWVSKRASA
jgi:hypothetical protein